MAALPGKTWRMAKPLFPKKNHLSSGSNRNYERDIAAGPTHEQRVGGKRRRSTKFCPYSLSRLVALRAVSHGRLPGPMQTGELVNLRPQGREVALC
jgi:hypothetical protein